MSTLPANWTLTTLSDIANWGSGGTPSRSKIEYYNGGIPWIKTGELGQRIVLDTEEKITDLGLKNSSAKIFPKGSVAIAMYGATIGKTSILGIDATTNQACAVGNPISGITTSEYLYHYLCSQKDAFIEAGKGGAQPNISQAVIKAWPIPLAPLQEQKRIADKLDTVLARVEACREHLNRVPLILKRFRQSVLAAATSGELTLDWRKSQQDLNDDLSALKWMPVTVSDICRTIFDGPFGSNLKSDDYTDQGERVVRLENIGHLNFDKSKETYISVQKYQGLEKHTLLAGDVLFSSFVDEEVRVCIFPDDLPTKAINKADCFCIRVNEEKVSAKFLAYRLACKSTYVTLKEQVHGATRPRINLKQLKQYQFDLPSMQEQQEIVRRIEALFAIADRLKKRLEGALHTTDRFTPALLAKAFRGELVSQDPNDEPATELLKHLTARSTQLQKSKRRSRTAAPALEA